MTLDLSHDAELRRRQLITDVRAGLTAQPRTLPSKYFYDARGSALFDRITRLPEYYPTRTERAILLAHADAVAAATAATTLVELGSGTSEKTRILIDALRGRGTLQRFAPLDVDPAVLGEASGLLQQRYPGLAVQPLVGDFEHPLPGLPGGGPILVAFLGSTVGNLPPAGRARFFADLARHLRVGDHLLLGADLVKAEDRLVAAYDDAAGVTADFNRNILRVINAELGADFVPDAFSHVARWNAEQEWMEMWLRSRSAQVVTVPAARLEVRLAAGEGIRTEISAKFRPEGLTAELGAAGLRVVDSWSDSDQDFALVLATPISPVPPSSPA